ncbi:hypothetical protein [Streptomyces sp. MUM 2J]|uniref:hypothetical protein n=1 Tax=unclassified Streptomyces TaxID=2593676 RepID=UPI0035ABD7FD
MSAPFAASTVASPAAVLRYRTDRIRPRTALAAVPAALSLTPRELTGHALGLHSAGMLTRQGASATLAGTAAQFTSAATAMTTMAAVSAATTVLLARAERRVRPPVPGPPPPDTPVLCPTGKRS